MSKFLFSDSQLLAMSNRLPVNDVFIGTVYILSVRLIVHTVIARKYHMNNAEQYVLCRLLN